MVKLLTLVFNLFIECLLLLTYSVIVGKDDYKRKKIKYRSIFFKVTDKQKRVIDDYCKKNSLSTVQLFKLALREYIEKNAILEQNAEEYSVSENQLSIFDIINELEQDE